MVEDLNKLLRMPHIVQDRLERKGVNGVKGVVAVSVEEAP